MATPAPVEYATAVDRYLGQAALGAASRRVYRISLVSWSWPLVGRPAPHGASRRGAAPPLVPLARLDDPATGPALAAALRERAAGTDVRTVNRELSALRSAVAWQWIGWGSASSELLRWLTAGRPEGPVFLTSRRAPAGTPAPDVCPLTGRARLSYRRAAEIFTEVTRPLDPAGRGWTLSQLRP